MEKTGRRLLSIFFLMMIFVVGAGTAWRSRALVRDVIDYKGFTKLKAETEDTINDKFLSRYNWINLNGGFYRLTGMTIVQGTDGNYDVYKLSNGQIMYNRRAKKVSKYAKRIIELRDRTEERGIGFAYAQLPFKIKDDSVMPPGTHTGGNENADKLVGILRENGVDVVDIRDHMDRDRWESYFFKTDHHWTPETGMMASGLIMEHLGGKYGFAVDRSHYDYDNYDRETYSDYMLGAVGRRVGAWYAGLDDIDIVYPKFETSMDFTGESDDGTDSRSGTFSDAVYYWENIRKRSDFVNNSYSTYIGKEYAVNELTNNLNRDGPVILLIRDSFSCVIEPFIGLDASKIIAVDMRRYKKGIDYACEKYDPDIVLLAYNPSGFTKKQFRFFKD